MKKSLLPGFTIRESVYGSDCTLVFRAVRNQDGLLVILKMLNADFPKARDIIRYKREFEIARYFDCAHLVKALELHFVQNKPVIVFEDIGGESLATLASRHDWTLREWLLIASGIAEGLAQCHARHVIHKDINPANIVFEPVSGALKIIDFGIASVLSREDPVMSSPEALEGTLAYMSPEQTGRMNRTIDYRTDFYSFGVTLYELLTGVRPFTGEDALELIHQHLTQTPRPAHDVVPVLPAAVSAIVAKLMAKAAEDRYFSGWGIKADIDHCITQLDRNGRIEPFTLGSADMPNQFQLPELRYGRECALDQMLEAFDAVSGGERELVLISGYSGIGKTSLVHELYKPATKNRAYIISGKFDQFQRNMPYTALVAAFGELVRQLLTESESALVEWRQVLGKTLGQNGQIILDAIPEMGHIIGPQPAVEALPPREARNRFNLVFQRFIQAFCQKGHPLVIFLDDLQWADNATLALLESLLIDDRTHHFLLISAYRDNEIAGDHLLVSRLDKLAAQGVPVRQIPLKPLTASHIEQMVADTLHCSISTASPLAALVSEKTGGNPFFVRQFLTELHNSSLIRFEAGAINEAPAWRWDVDMVREAGFTSNVVELLVSKLNRLPDATRMALRIAACIGNQFELAYLAQAMRMSLEQTYQDLTPALNDGLIQALSSLTLADPDRAESAMVYESFRFLHDRVQQAAYSLIPDEDRASVHLQIGRMLASSVQAGRPERLFALVGHLNQGRYLILESAELRQLARLNLRAAIRAKGAAAFSAALEYIVQGFAIGGGDWRADYELALGLHEQGAELHYLNGDYGRAETLIAEIWAHADNPADRARGNGQLVTQRTMLGKYEEAVEAAAQALRLFGVDFPAEEVQESALEAELQAIETGLAGRPVMALIDLPPMEDADTITLMKIFMNVHTTIFFTGRYTLYSWVLARMVSLSIRFGNLPESAKGYASFGNTLAGNLGRFEQAYEFGMLGLRLSERYRNQSLKCKTNLILSMFLNHWSHPIREAHVFDDEGQQAGMEAGEFQFVGYILFYGRTLNRFHCGDYLGNLFGDLLGYLRFTRKAKHNLSTDNLVAAGRVILDLMGEGDLSSLYPDGKAAPDFIETCLAHRSYAALAFFHATQAFRHYLFGDYGRAKAALAAARPLMNFVKGIFTEAAFVFWESLTLTAAFEVDGAPAEYLDRIDENQQLMDNWAQHAPANFRHKWLLVGAERARIEGRALDAIDGYDQAIAAAAEAGFNHDQALAHELAGRFWLARRKQEFALIHLGSACEGYRAWGARAKEQMLYAEFPSLVSRRIDVTSASSSNTATIHTTRQSTILAQTGRIVSSNLDLASVLKASQAISGEINLDKLLDRLLRVLIESAGAQYGCVLLQRDGELLLAASIDAAQASLTSICNRPIGPNDSVPHSVLNYVLRSGESVLLADAANDGLFTNDDYIRTNASRSVLCMPIRNGGVLIGLLYLENNQMTGAFPSGRMGLLNILSAQAAISIQNAVLYRDLVAEVEQHRLAVVELREAEEQYRTVFDSAADGIFRIAADGKLLLANPALARMLGFPSAASLIEYSGDAGVRQFIGPDLRAQLIQRFNRDGAIRNVEFKTTRRDGAIVEFTLSGHAGLGEDGRPIYYEGVVQDVTARKRVIELKIAKEAAEAAAHAKGEFLANMSHEIRTPMTAILGLTTLALKQQVPPRIKDYLQKIDTAGQALLGVINDILDFSKMDAGRLQLEAIPFDLRAGLQRLVDLFGEQASAKGIALTVDCAPNVPDRLRGDPNRLGQILTNLVSNAIKFTVQGGVRVEVVVEDCDEAEVTLSFAIRDSGIGMNAAQVASLFQAFYQADTSTTRHFGGTGLGLTISKNLAELMGGDISVSSEPGVGTVFVFTIVFPIAASNETDAALTPLTMPASLLSEGRIMRILLVEDNVINQQVATELLIDGGYVVEIANNGREAVCKVAEGEFDAVLMDIQMPEMDGYEATRQIRNGLSGRNIPIIAMTAHAIVGYREQCLARGMNDYVSKPIVPDHLYAVLARWCGQKTLDKDPHPVSLNTTPSGGEAEQFASLAPLIEVATVWRHVGGKAALLRRLLERFAQSAKDHDTSLRQALQTGDRETALRCVHTVKGMAGTLGASALRMAAMQFEDGIRDSGDEFPQALLNEYLSQSDKLREHIEDFLRENVAA